MEIIDSPTFLKICNALKTKRGYEFELICNDYLKARYPNLVPWVSRNAESTIRGTPDAFLFDESGAVIAGQYGGSPRKWRTKLFGDDKEVGDAEKVAILARDCDLTIRRLVFCTTAALDPEILDAAQKEVELRYGFPAEICDLRRISSDIERRYPGIAARRLGMPIPLQHFMTVDEYIDSGNQRYWPKRKDIEDGKVFTPSEYLEEIKTKFRKNNYCLLTGLSGSGKTVLAITYGLWWRGDMQNQNKHPEALIFYLDAASGHNQETGESWVRQVLNQDYQNGLFIVDNCHLSPAAINAFCFQLSRRPLEHSAVLLISTPKVPESEWEVNAADYFAYFEESDSVVEVQPEAIYKGVLRRYSEMYRNAEPARFVDVNVDFQDETRDQQLQNLCSHNLVAARGLLEAWGELGGQLSSIDEDEVLSVLAKRHLTTTKAPALGPLCSLASFEISIHNAFLLLLPPDSVKILQAENLLILSDSHLYGRSFRLALHPQVASHLFKAWIRQQFGAEYERHVDEQLTVHLKWYLLSGAKNIAEVYKRLYLGGARALQHTLLDDQELQRFISTRLNTIPIADVIRYSYMLKLRNPELASGMLQQFYDDCGPREFESRMLDLPANLFVGVLNLIVQINTELAKTILSYLPPQILADRVGQATLNRIDQWISPSPVCVAARLGYSIEWRRNVAQNLDLDSLVEKVKQANTQGFIWFLGSFIKMSPVQAQLLLDKLTPETLGGMLRGKPGSLVNAFVGKVKKLYEGTDFLDRVIATFDLDELILRVTKQNPSQMYWFTRGLTDVVPDITQRLERHLDPQIIIEQFKTEGDVRDLNRLWRSTSAEFMQRVLALMDEELAVAILDRTPLPDIAAFLEHRIYWFESQYVSFANKHLRAKLEVTDLTDLGKFITRVNRIDEHGHELAVQAIEILLQVDVSARVAQTDLMTVSLLCAGLTAVNPVYTQRLFQKITAEDMREAIKHSGLQGIQSIMHALAESESTLLEAVGDELRDADLTERIQNAQIEHLGFFLWNLRSGIGEELGKKYCQIIDGLLTPAKFNDATVHELGRLLWNLVQISETPSLRILEYGTIHERVKAELINHPGECMYVVGVISLVRPDIVKNVFLPEIDLYKVGGPLAQWLKQNVQGKHPYMFSLALQGVWAIDEDKAATLIQHIFRKGSLKQDLVTQLTEALTKAITPLSTTILKMTAARLEENGTA